MKYNKDVKSLSKTVMRPKIVVGGRGKHTFSSSGVPLGICAVMRSSVSASEKWRSPREEWC